MKNKKDLDILENFKKYIIKFWSILKSVLKKLALFLKDIAISIKNFKIKNWIIIILFLIISFTFYDNLSLDKNIDFDKEYYIISEKQAQTKYKSNITSGNYTYYIPKGYSKVTEDIFKNKNNYVQIIKGKESLIYTGTDAYTYNEDLKLIYDNSSINSDDSQLLMKVWDMGDGMYEMLLVDEEGNGVVADLPIVRFKEDVVDMANILNSIKLKGE